MTYPEQALAPPPADETVGTCTIYGGYVWQVAACHRCHQSHRVKTDPDDRGGVRAWAEGHRCPK